MDAAALGASLPLWSVLPFAGFLLAIALCPLVAPRAWARHYGKAALLFGAPVALWFLVIAPRELLHTAAEYASFLVLLGSLFTVSAGVLVRGTVAGTPASNAAFLAAGAVAANVFGTTGASMLLLRPYLRGNAGRPGSGRAVVFFIFVVSNMGGLLTPVGDPPLFLGYLRGVPFFWTLSHLWPIWLLGCGTVIAVYLAGETFRGRPAREARAAAEPAPRAPFAIEGKENLLYLAVVVGAVFLPAPAREIAMTAAAAASFLRTPARIREENGFSWHPIREVAILFAGIFAAMMPALLILKGRGGALGVTSPDQYFWATGGLSSVLDNAPTYLAFLALAQGSGGPPEVAGVPSQVLAAISVGAVFMGANSYIGNAPNFMVKAVAEGAGVRMPSFLGYMAYAALVLLPVFALVTWIFF